MLSFMGYTFTFAQSGSAGTTDSKLPNSKRTVGNMDFFYQNSDCGLDFTTVTKVLKQRSPKYIGVRQPATYNINNMPNNAIIVKAFIWASASATDKGKKNKFNITIENPQNQKSVHEVKLIGSGPDKCWAGWGYSGTYTYRAEVTSAITGNGSYELSGFPFDTNNLTNSKMDVDGATLFVIYRDPNDTTVGTIYIKDGATTIIGERGSSQILGGFNVNGTPSNVRAFAMLGDLQMTSSIDFGPSLNVPIWPPIFWNYVEGSPNLNNGQTFMQYQITANPTDCWVWTAAGIYWKEPRGGVKPDAKASSNSAICSGDTLKLNASGGKTYIWTGPNKFTSTQKDPIIIGANPNASGEYRVKVTNQNGACTDTAIINVKVNAPNISLSYNGPLCLGDTLILNATGGQTYQWTGPNNFNSNIPQPTINQVDLKDEGIYQVIVTDSNGCVDSASIKLNIDIPDIKIITNIPCIGDTLWLKGTGGSTYLWNGPQGLQSTDSILVIYPASKSYSGIYHLLGIDSNGCKDTTSINIKVNPNPIADAWSNVDSIPLSEFIKFIDSSKSNIISWHWDFGDQSQSSKKSPDHKYDTLGIFKVILKVTNKYGCTDTTIMYVTVYPKSGIFIPNVFIPNVFSPNGDGENDKFIITGNNFDEFTLKIYNRWGTLLFTSNNASKSWDGIITSTGQSAAAGNYYFILTAKTKDKDYSTAGYLTLFR